MSARRGNPVIACEAMELTTDHEARVVTLRFLGDTSLTGRHGAALVEAMKAVVGAHGERFGLLADAKGVQGTDADYRAATGEFFGQHRDAARIALINLNPIVRIVAEMFRVAIRLQLKTFADEAAARVWLQREGISA